MWHAPKLQTLDPEPSAGSPPRSPSASPPRQSSPSGCQSVRSPPHLPAALRPDALQPLSPSNAAAAGAASEAAAGAAAADGPPEGGPLGGASKVPFPVMASAMATALQRQKMLRAARSRPEAQWLVT